MIGPTVSPNPRHRPDTLAEFVDILLGGIRGQDDDENGRPSGKSRVA
jgi:hypothetical protein